MSDLTMTEEQRRAVAASFHDAFLTGDLDHLDHILAAGWVNHPRNPHEPPGLSGFKATVAWFRSVFPNCSFTIDDIRDLDDHVVIRSVVRGTNTGQILGRPATGRSVMFNAVEIHRFDGDRIVESWHLQDYFAMCVQLGLIPNVLGADVNPYPGWSQP